MWNTVEGRSSHTHSQKGSVGTRKIQVKLTRRWLKQKWHEIALKSLKSKHFSLLCQLKMQQIGESGFSVNFLSGFLNELLNSNLTGKLLKQHYALIVLSAGTEQNATWLLRETSNPWQGRTQKSALLPSSRSLIKLAKCRIQQLKVMWSPWVSHTYVLLRQQMKKKNHHFASQLVSPTHILYTEKTSIIIILV